jgi:hypothetical protein
VKVQCHYGPATGSGSGTVFHTDGTYSYVLTCWHVVTDKGRKADRYDVIFPNGRTVPAALLAIDDKADLACLCIAGKLPVIPLDDAMPKPGTVLWQVGYPNGAGPVKRFGASRGYIGNAQAPNGGAFANLQMGFPVIKGDSGSGLFTGDMKLVGVIWGTSDRTCHAVGLEDCQRFVEQTCKLFPRRSPAPKLPGPSLPPPTRPDAPSLPPPSLPGPSHDLESIKAQIDELREALSGLKARVPDKSILDRVDGLHKKIEAIPDRIKLLEQGTDQFSGMVDGLKREVEGAKNNGLISLDAAGKLGKRLDGLRGLIDAAGEKIGPLASVAGKVAEMEGKASLLPWISAAAGTGGAGLAGLAVLWLARRGIRKVVESRVGASQGNVQVKVVNEPPPEPIKEVIIRKERNYVPVETTNAHYEALLKGMDELTRRHPGAIDTIEKIKAYAAQFESGERKE